MVTLNLFKKKEIHNIIFHAVGAESFFNNFQFQAFASTASLLIILIQFKQFEMT
jgi:hypothetical protein